MRYLHWPLVLLGAAGSLMVWLPRLKYKYPEKSLYVARFVAALLLYFTAIHVIGAPFPRYSIPLRPFLYGMAIFCLHMFYTSGKTRKVII
jgi:glucan phosphoethanolaminetransferase (alkaline phosphatase superfamily)